MKSFNKFWEEIRRGENIDLYLTVFAAIILVLLNLTGFASQSLVAPLTLAVLGLLAVSNLGNRHQIQSLIERLSHPAETFFAHEFPENFGNDIEEATELWLVGVTLTITVRNYYHALEKVLTRGNNIKVLLVHPEDSIIEVSEMRSYARSSVARARQEILGALDDFCRLRERFPKQVEIRTILYPLGHGTFGVDIDSSQGRLYIANYPYKTPGGSKPKFVLRAKDGQWYDFYKHELHLLWNNGVEWKNTDKKQ